MARDSEYLFVENQPSLGQQLNGLKATRIDGQPLDLDEREEFSTEVARVYGNGSIEIEDMAALRIGFRKDGSIPAASQAAFARVYASTGALTKHSLVNNQGLDCDIVEDGSLHVYTSRSDVETWEEEFGAEEYRLAKELGLNALGFEYELLYDRADPHFQSANVHHTLGVRDADNNFSQIVTVLNPKHPARS